MQPEYTLEAVIEALSSLSTALAGVRRVLDIGDDPATLREGEALQQQAAVFAETLRQYGIRLQQQAAAAE